MPIYEYECQNCGVHVEKLQSVSEMETNPLKRCSECGSEALKRLISTSSFMFKGSGFYATDYPSKERTEALKAENKSSEKKLEPVVKKEKS